MDSSLQALADPRRRQIVELLLEQDRPVRELVHALPIAQSGVSRHLRILKDAGLVHVRAQGQQRIYGLRPEPFEQLSEWIARYRTLWESRLDRFEVALKHRQAADAARESE